MDLTAIDAYVAERFEYFRVPGMVYGVIADGRLAHVRSLGTSVIGSDVAPTTSTMFRIASMSKSFTAAEIMVLRDRGLLRLDDPIATYLPWTRELRPTGGGPEILVRDLLEMNAGFPTDDPWGDRQEGLPVKDFDALVADGLSFTRAPRMGFEYSNLGYALLGRVISTVTGLSYGEAIRRDLLDPLGMTRTRSDHREVTAPAAQGYHLVDGEFVTEPLVGPGAFTPMGGIFSCVDDLTTWVLGFLSSWSDVEDSHPVARWSRREMQQPHALVGTELVEGEIVTTSYGYGLMVDDFATLGRFVHHSGGYPGFGSHMRWHPESGLGIIALGNRTYAAMRPIAAEALRRIVADWSPKDSGDEPWPQTLEAMSAVETLIAAWDDALADQWFAMNMDLDVPRDVRRRLVGTATEGLTGPRREDLQVKTPAHVVWTLRDSEQALTVTMLMSPERSPRIQALSIVRQEPAAR